ncbi:hypothetical protein [Spiroplasma apis]|uniref:Lipoprotein n=1 Tax=Spiroplasma apis B31 TaxID=1276258 RepID=V5RJ58_SPIAP|nr:hypothetical protein [Spiroplasma apis]AHB36136.1 hypothetical protein SAPIS_v1c02900 [Spiroplasma apis B31]
MKKVLILISSNFLFLIGTVQTLSCSIQIKNDDQNLKDLRTINTSLGEFEGYEELPSLPLLIARVNKVNTGLDLNSSDISLVEETLTVFNARIKGNGKNVIGECLLTFKYIHKKGNLTDLITKTNLGNIKDNTNMPSNSILLNKINDINNTKFTFDDISISEVNESSARISANPQSTKYEGEVSISYNYKKVESIEVKNLINKTYLGKIYSQKSVFTSEEILEAASFHNDNFDKSISDALIVTNITSTSAIIKSNSNYSTFRGEVLVNYEGKEKVSLTNSIKNKEFGLIRGAKNDNGQVKIDVDAFLKQLMLENPHFNTEYIRNGISDEPYYSPDKKKYFLVLSVANSHPIIPYKHNTGCSIYFEIDNDKTVFNKKDLKDEIKMVNIGEIDGYIDSFNRDVNVVFEKINELNNISLDYQFMYYLLSWVGNNKVKIIAKNDNPTYKGEVEITYNYNKLDKLGNLEEIIKDRNLGEIFTYRSSDYKVYRHTIKVLLNAKYPKANLILDYDINIVDITDTNFKVEILDTGKYFGSSFLMSYYKIKKDTWI